jgi:hypothetical protein
MNISKPVFAAPVLTTLMTASLIFRHFRLSAAAGGGLAGRGFPDHPDHGAISGASPETNGVVGCIADRAPAVDFRHYVDELVILP